MKYSLFIGGWQPWHEGHRWLIDQRLNEGLNVCIAIRDVEKVIQILLHQPNKKI